MSLQAYRPLILRSNRFIGTTLVEKKLVTVEQLEEANEKLLEYIQKGDLRRANILHILLFEMQALSEDLYLDAVVEGQGVGLIDLHGCQFRKFLDLKADLTLCWATWTVPFDLVDDFYLIATVFYPSQPVVKFWEDKYAGSGGHVQWYATSVRSLMGALERLEQIKAEAEKISQQVAGASKGGPGTKSGLLTPRKGSKSPIPSAPPTAKGS
jgi:hypothetical protein